MSDAFEKAEQTPWLAGQRVRLYNPTVAVLSLLVPTLAAVPVVLEDPLRLWPIAFLFLGVAVAGLVALGRRATRGLRLNNGAVALMMRGEDLGAANAFRAAVHGFFGRDIVGMSLSNLGVLALRALDLPSAIALQRAAIAAGRGFRFRSQPSLATDLARVQLAFALAANGQGADLDEAAALACATEEAASPLAMALAVRARAMIAAKRGRFDEVLAIFDGDRALLRNVLPLNDAVLVDALESYALGRLGSTYRGGARAPHPVLADEPARAYVKRTMPAAESVLVS